MSWVVAETLTFPVVTRRVYQNRRVSSKKVRSRRTSIDQLSQLPMNYQRLSVKTKSLSLKSDLDKWYDTPSSPIQRCDSPASMWPCTGYCPPSTSEKEEADVVFLFPFPGNLFKSLLIGPSGFEDIIGSMHGWSAVVGGWWRIIYDNSNNLLSTLLFPWLTSFTRPWSVFWVCEISTWYSPDVSLDSSAYL